MTDTQLFALFWKLVATCICVVSICITVGVANSNLAIERAIAGGADPLRAACSIGACKESVVLALTLSRDGK